MMRIAAVSIAAALLATAAGVFAQPAEAPAANLRKEPPDSEQRIALARVQVALDRAGFRPGKIDGLGGEFTQRAADRWCDSLGLPRGSLVDVSEVPNPYREYTVAEADAAWVGPVSSEPGQQAKFKSLKYGDLWEAVAERFHCDRNFLVELNPGVQQPAVGTVLRVPDVPEFSIADVQALDKQRAAAAKKKSVESQPPPAPPPLPAGPTPPQPFDLNAPVSALLDAPQPTPAPEATPQPRPAPEPDRRLVLLRAERLIEVYEGDRIVACFPCTPGSAKFPVPEGTWKITSNTLMPYFRWDKSVLETGVRSENAHLLPPGPNSPVGIVWMGINRPSLGIHGTNSPDRIGRNESSGCIRLANWDAFLLCQLVKKGTPVEVR